MDIKRNKKHIEFEIKYNNQPGLHTFSMCEECNECGHRGRTRACNNCLAKELLRMKDE